jgi:hypothetical protein
MARLKQQVTITLMQGVDFDDPQLNIDWLNLSFYDDRDF